MRITRSLHVLLAFLYSNIGLSQIAPATTQNFFVHHFTDENGLPQNSVKNIAADKYGFIWLTTESGLVRFDGHQFYTYNKSNTALTGTWFYDFQPDLEGDSTQFYSTGDAEAMRIGNGMAVRASTYLKDRLRTLPHMKAPHYQRHVASGAPGAYMEGSEFLHYLVLCTSGAGNFFVVGHDKTDFFSNRKKQWTFRVPSDGFKHYFGYKNNLYRLTRDVHIERFGPKGLTKMDLTGAILDDPAYIPDRSNFVLYWNNIADQVFLLVADRFYHLQPGQGNTWTSKLILSGFDFKTNNIHAVHFDSASKRLFLGSLTRGLFVVSPRDFTTLTVSEKDNHNVMYAQALFDDKHILNADGYLLDISGRGSISALPALKEIVNSDRRAILIGPDKSIWVKHFDKLHQFDPHGSRILRVWKMGEEVKTLYLGKNGRIWLALNKKGLYYLDPGSDRPMPFKGPAILHISFIIQAGDTLWVATFNGVYRVNVTTGKTNFIPHTEKLFVRSLYISPSDPDAIFMTTYEDGIYVYKAGRLVHIPMDRNKHLTAAHCMVEDQDGYLWVPTNKGLFRFLRNDLIAYATLSPAVRASREMPFYLYYTRDSGFLTNEFDGGCQPCALKLPDGRVSLPSLNGLVIFRPEGVRADLPDKALFVDRLEVRKKSSQITGGTIHLPMDPEQINLSIAAPYFGDLENLHISYSLTPAGKSPLAYSWIDVKPTDPVIHFSRLDSGDYTLTIRKKNGFGQDNYLFKTLRISVPMHWYETWWARAALGIAVLLLIFQYVRFRLRKVERQNVALEARISQRTNDLRFALMDLEISKSELNQQYQIISRMLASITHDVQSPLKFIAEASQEARELIGNGKPTLATKILDRLTDSSHHVNTLVSGLLDYIKAHVYGKNLKPEPVRMKLLFEDKIGSFAGSIEKKQIRVINEVPEELTLKTDYQMFCIIVHNLIDNAVKYTKNGTIRVTYEELDQQAHLVISNSGIPMAPDLIDFFNEESTNNGMEGRTGLGFLIIKEIAWLNGIRLKVTQDEATHFYLIF